MEIEEDARQKDHLPRQELTSLPAHPDSRRNHGQRWEPQDQGWKDDVLIGQPDGPFSRKQALSNRCKAVGETCPNQNNSPEIPAGSSWFLAPGVREVGAGGGGGAVGLVLHSLFILHFVFHRCGILTVDTHQDRRLSLSALKPRHRAPLALEVRRSLAHRRQKRDSSSASWPPFSRLLRTRTRPEQATRPPRFSLGGDSRPHRRHRWITHRPLRVGRRTPGRPFATFPCGGPDLTS